MANFTFENLANGQEIAFNTGADVLVFQDASTSAAFIRLSHSDTGEVIVTMTSGPQAGKSVVLGNVFGVQLLSPDNFFFAGGGEVLIGDLTIAGTSDNSGINF